LTVIGVRGSGGNWLPADVGPQSQAKQRATPINPALQRHGEPIREKITA
jgi:hypothetical protein